MNGCQVQGAQHVRHAVYHVSSERGNSSSSTTVLCIFSHFDLSTFFIMKSSYRLYQHIRLLGIFSRFFHWPVHRFSLTSSGWLRPSWHVGSCNLGEGCCLCFFGWRCSIWAHAWHNNERQQARTIHWPLIGVSLLGPVYMNTARKDIHKHK